MADDSKTFDIVMRTTATGDGAERQKAALAAVTAETEKLTAAAERARVVQEVDLSKYEDPEKIEAAAAAEAKKSIELQKQVLFATALDALQTAASGDAAGAAKLGREAAILQESLNIQRAQNLTEKEALELAEAKIAAKEKILALDVGDEEANAAGPAFGRGGRLGSSLKGLGLDATTAMNIGFAVLTGMAAYREIERQAEAITKETEEQIKFNRELDKQREGFDKISSYDALGKETEKIREQTDALRDRREEEETQPSLVRQLLGDDTNPQADTDAQISALELQQELLDRAAAKAIERHEKEELVKEALAEQKRLLDEQIASYDKLSEKEKGEVEFLDKLGEKKLKLRLQEISDQESSGKISHEEAELQRAAAHGKEDKAAFDRGQQLFDKEKKNLADQQADRVRQRRQAEQDQKKLDDEQAASQAAINEAPRKTAQAEEARHAAEALRESADTAKAGLATDNATDLVQPGEADAAAQADKDAKAAEARAEQLENEARSARAVAKAAQDAMDARKVYVDASHALAEEKRKEEAKGATDIKDKTEKIDTQKDEEAQLHAAGVAAQKAEDDAKARQKALEDRKERIEEQIREARARLEALKTDRTKAGKEASAGTPRGKGEEAGRAAEAQFAPKISELETRIATLEHEKELGGKQETQGQKDEFAAQVEAIQAKNAAPASAGPSLGDIEQQARGAAAGDTIAQQILDKALAQGQGQSQDKMIDLLEKALMAMEKGTVKTSAGEARIAKLEAIVERLEAYAQQNHSP